jgi:hypothetical protein
LIDLIWRNRENSTHLSIENIKKSHEFKKCEEIFNPIFAPLLEEAVKDMICDV